MIPIKHRYTAVIKGTMMGILLLGGCTNEKLVKDDITSSFMSNTTNVKIDTLRKNNYENQNKKRSFFLRKVNVRGIETKISIDRATYLRYRDQYNINDDSKESMKKATTINEPKLDYLLNTLNIPTNNKEEDAQKILDFVHEFIYENDVKEYTKTPIETIVEGGGDCEDLSVLAYSLMHKAGIDVVYVRFYKHLAIGVAGNFEGAHIDVKGKKYFLTETTNSQLLQDSTRTKIGHISQKFGNNFTDVYKYDW